MQIHDLNTKALTDPAYVAFDDGTDTYKTEFNDVVANAAASAVSDADLTDNTVAFTSGDAASPTGWTAVDVLTSGLTIKVLFNRISTMVKNVRWLYSKLGTTDISSIGGGTVTGAISSLNSKFTSDSVPNNTNINTVLNSGVYLLSGSFTYTNAPDTYGVLEVLVPNPSGSIKVQRLTTVNTVYIRYYSGNNWTEWRKITSLAVT